MFKPFPYLFHIWLTFSHRLWDLNSRLSPKFLASPSRIQNKIVQSQLWKYCCSLLKGITILTDISCFCSRRRWWEFSWWSACWPPALCSGWLHTARLHVGSSAMAGVFRVCVCVCYTQSRPNLSHARVSFSPVCSDSSTRRRESCARWQGNRFPNQTGETGEKLGRTWDCGPTPTTEAGFDMRLSVLWLGSFAGGRMGRSSLSLCPKTSIFTWKRLQSKPSMLSVNLFIWKVESLELTENGSKTTFSFLFPVLRFFLEYQWLVDFAVYATGVFLFTECYYSVVDASKEVNIGAIWCVLTVLFGLYPPTAQPLPGWRTGGQSLLSLLIPLTRLEVKRFLN